MKKIKYLAVILAFGVFAFCGCSFLSDNLKIVKSNLSISSTYFNHINTVSLMQGIAKSKVTEQNTETNVNYLFDGVFGTGNEILAIICTADFGNELLTASKSDITEKLYKINNRYISINKTSRQSRIFNVTIYENQTTETVDFSNILFQENSKVGQYSIDVKTGTNGEFGLTYSNKDKKNCSAKVFNNLNESLLKVELNAYNKNLSLNPIKTTLEIYSYQNNVYGSRQIVEFTSNDGARHGLIWESLAKDFYKKAKIGEIKDESEYYTLDKISEEKFASFNSGDLFGFYITYDNLSDNRTDDEQYTAMTSYGVFKN